MFQLKWALTQWTANTLSTQMWTRHLVSTGFIEFQSSKSCPGNIYLKLQNTWNFFTATPSEFVEKIVLPNWKTLRSVCVSSLRQQCFWAVSKANTKVETCLISGSQNWFWLNDFTGCNLFSWKRLSNSNIQTTRTKFGCGCP